MRRVSNSASSLKTTRQFTESIWLGMRVYRSFISNLCGVKAPFFCGHKLTYNCNLKCKMCPFWKRASRDSSLEQEKKVLKEIYRCGAVGVAFEGGEPLLRRDLVDILAYSRSLPLHTSLITNGILLESRIEEIAPYINGVIYVSLDGLEKTHDDIRGVRGSFRRAVDGIEAAKKKAAVTINTTVMAANLHDIVNMVQLASDLGTKISVAVAHEYCNTNMSAPAAKEIPKIARQLIKMKQEGYPLVNSTGYFKVMSKEKPWQCKPWTMLNIDPNGNVVLPCYVHNDYSSTKPIVGCGIKGMVAGFDWKKIEKCQRCSLHCYVEPSLVLSKDIRAYMHWAFRVNL